jgi:hypothetical protein
MALFTPLPSSYAMSWHWRPKPRPGPSLSMHKKAPSSAQPSLSLAIPNRPPRFNPIIQPPQIPSTPRFANGAPRLLICAFIGSATASNTVTSSFTGAPGTENLADNFTKHHPTAHHRLVRNTFLHPTKSGARVLFSRSEPHQSLQGCVVFSPQCSLLGSRLLRPITH